MNTNDIEKSVVLRAPLERVWKAISASDRFGSWFGVAFDGPFIADSWLNGRIVPTTVDPDVAKLQEPYAGALFRILIDRIEPMHRFSFRWHPFAIDPCYNYAEEPMTLVTFALKESTDGILVTITESGFDRIPIARRARAFEANVSGWTHQATLIEKYLARQRTP
jgi:uncharacterized protein YndB with AHSA1/START domain